MLSLFTLNLIIIVSKTHTLKGKNGPLDIQRHFQSPPQTTITFAAAQQD